MAYENRQGSLLPFTISTQVSCPDLLKQASEQFAAVVHFEHHFTRLGSPVSFFPFTAAIRLLGEGGWELVSVQNATFQRPVDPQKAAAGWWVSDFTAQAIAYFKRPILAGRAITEPPLPSY